MNIEPQAIANAAVITICILGSIFMLLTGMWVTRRGVQEVANALAAYIIPDDDEIATEQEKEKEEEKTS